MNDWFEDRMIRNYIKEVMATLRTDIPPPKLRLLVSFEIVKNKLTMPFNAYIWWAEPPRDIKAYKSRRSIVGGQFYSHVLKLLLDSKYAHVPKGFQCEDAAFKAFEAIVFHLPLIGPMWLDEHLDKVPTVYLTGTVYDWEFWTFDKLAEWALDGKFTVSRVEKYLDRYVWRGLSDWVEEARRIFMAKMEEFGSSAPGPREALELGDPENSDDDGSGADANDLNNESDGDDSNAGGDDDSDGAALKRSRSRTTKSPHESKRRRVMSISTMTEG